MFAQPQFPQQQLPPCPDCHCQQPRPFAGGLSLLPRLPLSPCSPSARNLSGPLPTQEQPSRQAGRSWWIRRDAAQSPTQGLVQWPSTCQRPLFLLSNPHVPPGPPPVRACPSVFVSVSASGDPNQDLRMKSLSIVLGPQSGGLFLFALDVFDPLILHKALAGAALTQILEMKRNTSKGVWGWR